MHLDPEVPREGNVPGLVEGDSAFFAIATAAVRRNGLKNVAMRCRTREQRFDAAVQEIEVTCIDLAPNRSKDFGLHARTNRILQGLLRVAVEVVTRDRYRIVHLAERLLEHRVMTLEAIDAAWEKGSRPVILAPACRNANDD